MFVIVLKLLATLVIAALCFAVAFQTAAYSSRFENMGMDALVPIGLIGLAAGCVGGAVTAYFLFFWKF